MRITCKQIRNRKVSLWAIILLSFFKQKREVMVRDFEREAMARAVEGENREPDVWDNLQSKSLESLLANPGYIPIPLAAVKEELGLSHGAQTRLIGELKRAGLIKVKRVGLPSKRWVNPSPNTTSEELIHRLKSTGLSNSV